MNTVYVIFLSRFLNLQKKVNVFVYLGRPP